MKTNPSRRPAACCIAAIALAPLGIASEVHAQAPAGSLQIYGSMTAAVTTKNNQTGGSSLKELTSSLLAASLLGFRGTEDLGGGMSALFRLESVINADTGVSGATVAGANKFWNRQSYVGLNPHPAVAITAGRQFHAATDRVIRTLDVYNVAGTSLHVTPLALHGTNRFFGNDSRVDDSVKVRATGPVGLQGGASFGFDDGAGRSVSADLAQVTGAYSIAATATKYRSPTLVAATGARPEYTLWSVGGNGKLGPVTLYLHVIDAALEPTVAGRRTQDNRVVHLGAHWLATPLVSVKIGLYDDKGRDLNGIAGRNGKKETVVLSAEYSLSRRTSLNVVAFENRFTDGYKLDPANIAGLNRDPNASSTRGLSAGIRHDF